VSRCAETWDKKCYFRKIHQLFLESWTTITLRWWKNVKLVSGLQNEQVNDILYNMRTRFITLRWWKNVKLVSGLQNEQVNDILYNMRTRLVVELKMAGGVFLMKLASLDWILLLPSCNLYTDWSLLLDKDRPSLDMSTKYMNILANRFSFARDQLENQCGKTMQNKILEQFTSQGDTAHSTQVGEWSLAVQLLNS